MQKLKFIRVSGHLETIFYVAVVGILITDYVLLIFFEKLKLLNVFNFNINSVFTLIFNA